MAKWFRSFLCWALAQCYDCGPRDDNDDLVRRVDRIERDLRFFRARDTFGV